MKITKFGHCCLLIEEQGLRILTDPGAYSSSQNEVKDVDVILITHEHPDHLHVESLKTVMANNPKARVITNASVGQILTKESIAFEVVDDGKSVTVGGVLIEGYGKEHADIYPGFPRVENTGYRIAESLYYPGDAFHAPGVPVQILALPVAGPWLKASEAIDFAKAIKPRLCFPVHDGMLKIVGPAHFLPQMMLAKEGIQFQVLEENVATEL